MDNLTEAQLELLQMLTDNFTLNDRADLSILYEVTGYQGESDDLQFWVNYQEIEGLDKVREGKNEQRGGMVSGKAT